MRISDWSSDVCSADLRRAGQGSVLVHLVEYFANNVETGRQIRTTHAEEYAYGFAHFGLQLVLVRQGVHGAVEHHMLGILVQQFFQRKLLQALGTVLLSRIEFTLHDVELAIDLRKTAFRSEETTYEL